MPMTAIMTSSFEDSEKRRSEIWRASAGLIFALDLLDLIKEYSGDKPMESTNDLQCSDFATGKVAMIHNGSWDEASIRAIAPDIDMGYVYMPRMDEKAVLAVESNLTFRVAKIPKILIRFLIS